MKKISILINVLLLLSYVSFSQKAYTTNDIFSIDEVTWFGLDFSEIRLIGDDGFNDPESIVENQFRSMNTLVLNESEKFMLKSFFYKKSVESDLSIIRDRNETPDPDQIVLSSNTVYSLDETKIENIISEYETTIDEGIGVVFIMESFNKPDAKGYMWVTFFDIASRQVLLTEKMTGKAGGFGWRNYWVKTYYSVMKEIEKNKYNSWESKYQ